MTFRRTSAKSSCSSIVRASAALLLLATSQTWSPAAADDDGGRICSCSPTVFEFVLNLDGPGCEINDIEENPGVEGSFCFTETGLTVPAPPAPGPDPGAARETCQFCPGGIADPNYVLPTEDGETCGSVNDYAATITPEDDMCENIKLAEPLCCVARADGPVRGLGEARPSPPDRRRLQDDERVVEVVSVQFLEFDLSGDLTVINQDDTYADVSLTDGDRLRFNSASSFLDTSEPLEEQTSGPALVPGAASLILYGKTASGEVVRNRLFWQYDMSCDADVDPVQGGDEIGWVRVGRSSANAWPAFCPALPAGSPTISPRTVEPTISPSVSPTGSPVRPTPPPTNSPTPRGSILTPHPTPRAPHPNGPVFKTSKSAKSKTPKPPGKGSKSAKTKCSKSAKSSKESKYAKTWSSWDNSSDSSSDSSMDSSSDSSADSCYSKSSKSAKGAKHAKAWSSWDSSDHEVQGKTGKSNGWNRDDSNLYNTWRIREFDAESSSGPAGSRGRTHALALASFVACFLLFVRQ